MPVIEEVKTVNDIFPEAMIAYNEGNWEMAYHGFVEAAAAGHVEAKGYQSRCLAGGLGVEPDLDKARQLAVEAADEGSHIAMTTLGELSLAAAKQLSGDSAAILEADAYRWFLMAAEAGDAAAAGHVGECHLKGVGVEADPVQALEWFERAAEEGDPDALHQLGQMYAKGMVVAKDIGQALNFSKRAAEKGSAAATFFLAVCHLQGDGVEEDPETGLELLQRASELGDPDASLALGNILIQQRQYVPAFQLFYQAANLGSSEGQLSVAYNPTPEGFQLHRLIPSGLCFLRGQGVQQNFMQGLNWLNKAAQNGEGQAQLLLGSLLRQGGEGVIPKNPKVAALMFQQAADQGLLEGNFFLAQMYEAGEGESSRTSVSHQMETAVQHYKKVAELKTPHNEEILALKAEALYKLGWFHEHGIVLEQSLDKAFPLYMQAAQTGSQRAMARIDEERAKLGVAAGAPETPWLSMLGLVPVAVVIGGFFYLLSQVRRK